MKVLVVINFHVIYVKMKLSSRNVFHDAEIKRELDIMYRYQIHLLLGRHSELNINNRLFLYKQVLKEIWIYGLQLWD